MEQLRVVQIVPDHEHLQELIRKLDDYLYELYPAHEVFVLDVEESHSEDIIFLIAYWNDTPAGCGALRVLDQNTVELKRFFVEQTSRNKGIAGMLLAELESKAREMRIHTIKLETGEAQVEAMRFYQKHGYVLIDRFGEYVNCESSVCYGKQL